MAVPALRPSLLHVVAGHGPIRLAHALSILGETFRPVTGMETVPLRMARSRILAEDVTAPIPVPASDNSAVDGYAFRHADLALPGTTRLRVVGTAAAGHPFGGPTGAGEAIRILTGAVMPDGVDTVAMQEDVCRDGAIVTIPPGIKLGDNRRRAGEDIARGSLVFTAGRRLGAAEIGMLASLGLTEVAVRLPLKVAVFSTGDELIDGDTVPAAGQIYDANRPLLITLLAAMGAEPVDLGILPDCPQTIRVRLAEAALMHDAIVCTAGMSVGDEDHVRGAVEELGALDLWSVAIKPGKPIGVGRVGDVPFFGLPGNPAAMTVSFLAVVRQSLLRLAGAEDSPPRRYPVIVDFTLRKKPGRREFLRCTLHETVGHRLLARRLQRDGAGVLSSIAESEGLLEIDEDVVDVRPGMVFPFTPFAGLGL